MAILGATLPAVFAIMLSSQTMATQITQDIQKQPALEKIRGEPGDDKNLEENLRILRIIIEERLNFFSLQMLKLDTLNRLILHSHIPGGEFLQGELPMNLVKLLCKQPRTEPIKSGQERRTVSEKGEPRTHGRNPKAHFVENQDEEQEGQKRKRMEETQEEPMVPWRKKMLRRMG